MQRGMYIDNLLTLRLMDSFRKASVPEYSFNYIRSGLEFILKQSSLKKAKRILCPAFICPVVPETIRKCGMEVRTVDADLKTWNMDVNNLPDADAALVCHTFGARCNIPEKMPIIEDCAHFFDKKLEGDFGLYSLSKQLPNLRGGYVVTEEDLSGAYDHLDRDRLDFGVFVKIGGPHRRVLNFLRSKKRLPECQSDEGWNILKAPRIFSMNFDRKTQVYKQLKGHFEKLELGEHFLLQHMPKDSVPFNFSIRLKEDSAARRDEILLKLRRKGVFGDRLWYNADTSGHSNASLLARTVVNLPLHPQVLVKLKHVI